MAILDFPPSPAIGTLYPNPAVQGQPQYTYDGEKWISGTGGGAIYISDSAPAAPVGSLWWESDTSILYIRFFDGDSTQWCQVLNGPADAVRFGTAQSLTAPQQVQARSNVYAASFDAMAYSGLQVNGAADVSQENGAAVVALSNAAATKWIADCIGAAYSQATLVMRAQQTNTANAAMPSNFANAVQLQATTPVASFTGNDYAFLTTSIEGYRAARLDFGTAWAQPITIGFWVYATVAGTMCLAVENAANNRAYCSNVVINNAAIWEYKTVTIPGDTTGTWDRTTGTGLKILFTFGIGTTYRGTNNTWVGINAFGTAATTNFFANANSVVAITGIIVLPGIEAPSAARSAFIMRPFDQELVTCQRYWQKSYDYGTALGTVSAVSGMSSAICDISGNLLFTNIVFKTRLRASPASQLYSYNGAISKWTKQTGNTDTATCSVALTGESGYPLLTASGLVSTAGYYGHWTADARL